MARRMAASAIDARPGDVGDSRLLHTYFFDCQLSCRRSAKDAGAGVLLSALFWSAYQYLLLVYSGTTPGLKLAKLELHRFDGSPVPLRLTPLARVTSVLSGLSSAWATPGASSTKTRLCWHDRITRTYMAPKTWIYVGRVPVARATAARGRGRVFLPPVKDCGASLRLGRWDTAPRGPCRSANIFR